LCLLGEPGHLERSLELAGSLPDPSIRIAALNNLAGARGALHRAGREEDAMEELKRAVAIFAEVGGHDEEPRPGVWQLVEW